MSDRPSGVTILAILYLILGLISLLWSGLVFGFGGLSSLFGGLFGADQIASFGDTTAWSGFVGLIGAAVQIVVALGLLRMKKWSWILALIGVAVALIQGLVFMFSDGLFGFMCGSLSLIIPVIILIYLLRPSIRDTFGVGSS
jgi:hypothetical protein